LPIIKLCQPYKDLVVEMNIKILMRLIGKINQIAVHSRQENIFFQKHIDGSLNNIEKMMYYM